jgi:hypothetical protein
MTEKERYKKVFDTAASFGMENLEAEGLMKNAKRSRFMKRAVGAAAMVLVLLTGSTGMAYAANVGGIQRTLQLWIHGDQTNATIEINPNDGSYSMEYTLEDGSTVSRGGGGIAIEADGTERALTEEELMEHISMPDVEYEENGTVTVYYYNQKIDITDKFTDDGVCYVKLINGEETLYMTIKYQDGYSFSKDKYPAPTFSSTY